jgi:hypothetical protein
MLLLGNARAKGRPSPTITKSTLCSLKYYKLDPTYSDSSKPPREALKSEFQQLTLPMQWSPWRKFCAVLFDVQWYCWSWANSSEEPDLTSRQSSLLTFFSLIERQSGPQKSPGRMYQTMLRAFLSRHVHC